MEQYKKLLRVLAERSSRYTAIDGFSSGELRQLILNDVQKILLHAKPEGETSRFMPLSATEQIRAEYFWKAQEIGASVARKHTVGLLRENTPEYLRNLIIAGAKTIGCRIGRGYAAEIYPELRRLQVAGIPVKSPDHKTPAPDMNYTFTVINYGNCLEISEVKATGDKPGSEIFYDDLNDRHIEKFVLPSVEEADHLLDAWEHHRRNPDYPPPVKYGITIEQETPFSTPEISSIVHILPDEKGDTRILENGVRLEKLVFPTLEEAEKRREEKLHTKTNPNGSAAPKRKYRTKSPKFPLPEPLFRKRRKRRNGKKETSLHREIGGFMHRNTEIVSILLGSLTLGLMASVGTLLFLEYQTKRITLADHPGVGILILIVIILLIQILILFRQRAEAGGTLIFADLDAQGEFLWKYLKCRKSRSFVFAERISR